MYEFHINKLCGVFIHSKMHCMLKNINSKNAKNIYTSYFLLLLPNTACKVRARILTNLSANTFPCWPLVCCPAPDSDCFIEGCKLHPVPSPRNNHQLSHPTSTDQQWRPFFSGATCSLNNMETFPGCRYI